MQTVHLGIDLAPDADSGRYKVTHVFEEGPADKDWIKISVGNYLLAIDGQPIQATDSLWKLLTNRRLNKKVKLTLNSKPSDEGLLERPLRADFVDDVWQPPLRAVGQRAAGQGR